MILAGRSRERAEPSSTSRPAAYRTLSTAAKTRGSRRSRLSQMAGEPGLPVRRVSKHEAAPSSVASARLPARFARNASGCRATRLGKETPPPPPFPRTSAEPARQVPRSRRPEPSTFVFHPSTCRFTDDKAFSFSNRNAAKTKNRITDAQATATARLRRPLPPRRLRRRGPSRTPPACTRTRTQSSTWGVSRWAPAGSTRRGPGATTRPREPPRRRRRRSSSGVPGRFSRTRLERLCARAGLRDATR